MRMDKKEFRARLGTWQGGAAAKLESLMTSSDFDGVISAADAAELAAEMNITVAELALELVPFARLYAVAPISNYKVGAVALGLTGALYYGANLEVYGQALSFALHAEQSATSNAWLHGELGLATLAVSAAPCGYCRQFLYELTTADNLGILLPDTGEQSLLSLLPDPFGPEKGGLMEAQDHGLFLSTTPNEAGAAALAAANASYSPYTSTFAGVALRMSDGTVLCGRYAENVAFNPSLSPLEAALSIAVFNDYDFDDISEAVLVELPGAASQVDATEAVLGCVARNANLTVLYASQREAGARSARPRQAAQS
jgi:cytidine deaminase